MSLTNQTKGMVYRTYLYYLQYGDLGMVYDIVLPTFMGMIRGSHDIMRLHSICLWDLYKRVITTMV